MMQTSLPQKLRVLRAERGLTLEDAAEKTGVTRETLGLLERGKRRPHTPTLSKIAKGYGVPVEELLEEAVTVPLAPLEAKADLPEAKAVTVTVGELRRALRLVEAGRASAAEAEQELLVSA